MKIVTCRLRSWAGPPSWRGANFFFSARGRSACVSAYLCSLDATILNILIMDFSNSHDHSRHSYKIIGFLTLAPVISLSSHFLTASNRSLSRFFETSYLKELKGFHLFSNSDRSVSRFKCHFSPWPKTWILRFRVYSFFLYPSHPSMIAFLFRFFAFPKLVFCVKRSVTFSLLAELNHLSKQKHIGVTCVDQLRLNLWGDCLADCLHHLLNLSFIKFYAKIRGWKDYMEPLRGWRCRPWGESPWYPEGKLQNKVIGICPNWINHTRTLLPSLNVTHSESRSKENSV